MQIPLRSTSLSSSSRRARAATIALIAAALGATTAATLIFGCSSDATSGIAADDDGGTGDGAAELDAGNPADEDHADAPFMSHADAGCPVKYAGPSPGTVVASVPRAGAPSAIAWTTPEGALTVDGQFARAMLDNDQASEHLRVTGYGFRLPASVTIKGVVVQLKRKGQNAIVDGNIELWLDGKPSDRPKFVATGWPNEIGTHHYGQEVDTWGNDLTPELIGRPGFGTEIYATRRVDAGTGPVAAEVESLLITIWYCE